MPMPRCRYFEDNGKPINGVGCRRRGNCHFVHPDDPDWKYAKPPRSGDPPSWRNASDFSRGPTSTNTTKLPETGNRWGSGSASADRPQSSASKPSMSTEIDAVIPTEWQLSSKEVRWAPTSTKWESTSWGDQVSGSGWGTSLPKEATSGNTLQWGQASRSNAKVDESNPTASDSACAMDTTEASVHKPTPPTQKVIPPPGRSDTASTQKPELKRLDTHVQSRLPSTPTSAMQTPSPTKKVVSNPLPNPLQATAHQLPPNKQRHLSKGKPYPKKYLGPNGRINLFQDTLLRMQDAIIAELVYQHAARDSDRWKRTQISDIYGHATPEARKILDGNRNEFYRKVTEAKKKRDIALTALIQLPDLDAKRHSTNPDDTMEQVTRYTRELKEWFIEAKLPERLVVKKKEEEEKAKGPPKPVTAHELLQRSEWTWGELWNAISVVEERLTSVSEEVYNKTTRRADPDHYKDDLQAVIPPDLFVRSGRREVPLPPPQIQELKAQFDATGEMLEVQGAHAAALFQKLENMKAERSALVAEKNKINELCDRTEAMFVDFEKQKVSLEAEIESLKQQLQTLHLYKRPSPAPPTIDYDQIVQPLMPKFFEALQTDLQTLFGVLNQRVEESQASLQSNIDAVLTPVVMKTEAIRKAAANLSN